MLTTVGGIAALITTGGFLLRRRISQDWIKRSSITFQQFTKGETIVITGGNAGLGFEAAKDLATCGGKVILACRNVDAGKDAALQIRQSTGNDDVDCMKLDLSSLDSVRTFASELKGRNENIYALICNAGVWVPDNSSQKTSDGFEIHFGVNHLGHFALIQSLIPQLQKSGMDSRIIIVSSALCKSGRIDMEKRDFVHEGRVLGAEEKKSFAPLGYCDSKLMNMLTCRELAVKLQGTNITTYSVSPGFCQSQLNRHVRMPIYINIFAAPALRFFQRSSAQGSYNITFATLEDKAKLESGGMYRDGKLWEDVVKLVESWGDNDLQRSLWELSDELIKEK